ncbi:hypothetical protein BJV78DRAFT_860514, partial [Lactifluus subvellereus]
FLIPLPIRFLQTFRAHWRDEGSRIDTVAYITLDGYKVTGRFLWGKGKRPAVACVQDPILKDPEDAESLDATDPEPDPK